jgi:hypothetical protein
MRRRRRDVYMVRMNRYLIERTLPGAGRLSADELRAISHRSVEVLAGMAPRAQWVHSYVTDDKIICEYLADNEAALREHGACGGFPVDHVHVVHHVIDPMTSGV